MSKGYCHAIAKEITYDTLEGKDSSQPSVGDKQREGRNDVRDKPTFEKQAEQHDNTPDKQPRAMKDINIISGGSNPS
ncbi:unnamed protein product [Prunus armeniaca]|uniref:Uncharacterized protein n=1 Tax=Prunus armeniaca TaxID=36596 RepID=A0A6J5VR48_PRUAR|nr:unnamed protein product [Prunus armeniaca]CAB4320202.1 unnamed protein product [Prunus armeniaca]